MFIARSLAGLRFAVKDNIDATGFPTTAGTPGLAHCPGRDAPVVAWLKAAGAHLVGKTNMHELSLGITSNNPHTGPVPNPADRSEERRVGKERRPRGAPERVRTNRQGEEPHTRDTRRRECVTC